MSMAGRELTVDEFRGLFSCETDDDYRTKAPSWLWHIQPPTDPDNNVITNNAEVEDALNNLQKSIQLKNKCAVVLESAGMPLPKDIPYDEAKSKITEISNLLQSTMDGDEYNRLCSELEMYSNALMATSEYQAEVRALEQAWEDHCAEGNELALRALRRHIPPNIRLLSETQLQENHGLPKAYARKFQRTNILQLVRTDPEQLEKMHPSLLENYKTTGLTLTERRALYAHLKSLGDKWQKKAAQDPMTGRKFTWWNMLRNKLKESLATYEKHQEQYGSADPMIQHKCNLIGMQCPFKANNVLPYNGDFGFPPDNVYEQSLSPESSASIVANPQRAPPPKAKSGLLQQLAQPVKLNATKTDSGRPELKLDLSQGMSKLKEVKPKKVSNNLLQELKKPQSLNTSSHNDLNEPKISYLKEIKPIPRTVTEDLVIDEATEREEDDKLTEHVLKEKTSVTLDRVEVEKVLSPKERQEQHRQAIFAHYKGRPKQLEEALSSMEEMNQIMDQIDADLNLWVERMIHDGGRELDDEEKDEDMQEYNDLINSYKVAVDDLTERAKWVARSEVECLLAEDVYRFGKVTFNFILGKMREYNKKDKKLKNNMKELKESLNLIHDRNVRTLKKYKVEESEPTRSVLTIHERLESYMKKNKKKKKGKKKSKKTDSSSVETPPIEVEDMVEDAELKTQSVPDNSDDHTEAPTIVEDDEDSKGKGDNCDDDVNTNTIEPVEADKDAYSQEIENWHDHKTLEEMVVDVSSRSHLKWQLIRQLEDAIKTSRRYETAVQNAGLSLPEEGITYKEAEAKITETSQRMNEIGYDHPEYFKLEQEMQKYTTALMASDEYKKELLKREREWEQNNEQANIDALKALRRHMPINIRVMSEDALISTETPNGKKLPKSMIRKFKRTNSLLLIRVHPENMEKMHFADLEGLSLSGITLTELRALYQHLKFTGAKWLKARGNNQIERKYMWFSMVQDKLKQQSQKWDAHVKECGPPHVHKGCKFVGNMCPFAADLIVDYSGDYGFSDRADYEVIEIAKEDMERYKST